MDVYVLLDVLLIILIALFIPIGFWRGAYREAFVTLGILFGAAMGRFWGEDWGMELAAVTRLHESGGAFMIAMLCLISATFLLGYSSGAAIPVPEPGWVARALGALIAGANGALLLSFALRDIREYLLSADDSGFLERAFIAPFLSDGTGWILLVAAAVFVPIALVLALFGPDIEEDEFFEEDEFELYEGDYPEPQAQQTMQRPGFAQQGHQPPVRPTPEPAEATRPIPSVQHPNLTPSPQYAHQPPPEHQERIPAHHRGAAASAPELAPTQRQVPQPEETQPHRPQMGPQPPRSREREQTGAPSAQPNHEQQGPAQPEVTPSPASQEPSFGIRSVEESAQERQVVFGHRPSEHSDPAQTQQRNPNACPNCQADISEADGYCPRCGERI